MNRTLALLFMVGSTWLLVDKPMLAQPPSQPPNLQQQLKHGFNQAKNRVAQLFVRPQKNQMSNNRTIHASPNQHYQQATHSHRQPMQGQPMQGQPMQRQPMQRPPIRPAQQTRQPHGQPVYEDQPFQSNHAVYPNHNMTAQAVYMQQPQPDQNTLGSESTFSPQPQELPYPQETTAASQFPASDPRSSAQMNSGPPIQANVEGWSTQSRSNYQNYLRSGAAISNKPPTMDYYNERQFRHFSDRISATERAIILEDELANAREDNRTLESKIRSLEAQLKQRDFEIEQLQSAVNDAIEQLSTASSRHNQLQEQVRMITSQRSQERAAYEKLLDELRQQLNDLLANELIGSG